MPCSLVSLSHGQNQERHRVHHEGHERKEIKNKIPDLTDQHAELKQLKLKYDKESLPLYNELREQEAHLITLATSEK